jgi:hypothetical protein
MIPRPPARVRSERERFALARVPGAPPWWLVGAAIVVLVLASLDVAHHGFLTDIDGAVSRRMIDWDLRGNHAAKPLIHVLTLFGQRGPVLLVSIPVVCYLTWRSRRSEFALRYALGLMLLTIVVYAFKGAIDRYPPVIVRGKVAHANSYPSGHIANAILVWGVVAWSAARAAAPLALRRVLRVVRNIAPVAVTVGMTLLNYHWVSDFVGGACIGVVLLAVVLLPVWSEVAARLDRRLPLRTDVS